MIRSGWLTKASQSESILSAAMRALLRSVSLQRALQLAIVATVVLMVLSAGAVLGLIATARRLSWLALLVLAVLALVYTWRRGAPVRAPGVYVGAGLFLA